MQPINLLRHLSTLLCLSTILSAQNQLEIRFRLSNLQDCDRTEIWNAYFQTLSIRAVMDSGAMDTAIFNNYSPSNRYTGRFTFAQCDRIRVVQIEVDFDRDKSYIVWPPVARMAAPPNSPFENFRLETITSFQVNRKNQIRSLVETGRFAEADAIIQQAADVYRSFEGRTGGQGQNLIWYRHELRKSAIQAAYNYLRSSDPEEDPELKNNLQKFENWHFKLMSDALQDIESKSSDSEDPKSIDPDIARFLQGASLWIAWSKDKRYGGLRRGWPDKPLSNEDLLFKCSVSWPDKSDFKKDVNKLWSMLVSETIQDSIKSRKTNQSGDATSDYFKLPFDEDSENVSLNKIEVSIDRLRSIWGDPLTRN